MLCSLKHARSTSHHLLRRAQGFASHLKSVGFCHSYHIFLATFWCYSNHLFKKVGHTLNLLQCCLKLLSRHCISACFCWSYHILVPHQCVVYILPLANTICRCITINVKFAHSAVSTLYTKVCCAFSLCYWSRSIKHYRHQHTIASIERIAIGHNTNKECALSTNR